MNATAIQEIPKPETGEQPIDMGALRARCNEIIERDGVSKARMAELLGLKNQTFQAWLNDTYAGRNDLVAKEVAKGLASLDERERASAILPPDLAFVETPTARKIRTHLQFAHYSPAIVAIAAGAGLGKSKTIRHYQATTANVWVATAEPCTATVYPMLGLIADAMGIEEKVQTRLSSAIKKYVSGKGGLLIIDEAQHLETKALDQLRSLPDAVEIGLALVGNERVYAKLEGGGRKAEFAQLFSRIGKTMTQARPHTADVEAIVSAWGITGTQERKLLRTVASKGGALRAVSMTLRAAAMMAGGVDRIELKHLRAAFEDLSHQTIQGSV